jgi:hypothetical protein
VIRARVACALAVLVAAAHAARAAEYVYAWNATDGHLVSFWSDTPGVLEGDLTLTGLDPTEELLGLDFRPADGFLYAVASSGAMSRLVRIHTASGAVTQVGQLLATPYGTSFGLDVNPVADRIRFVGDADVSQRIDADTGALVATDNALVYAGGDAASGQDPNVVHVAYTNSFLGAATTTLYGIDTGLDTLVVLPSPNNGLVTTVGPLGVDATGAGGFDIAADGNVAFAALRAGGTSLLYVVNLSTGAATLVGTIGGGGTIAGMAVPEPGAVAAALCAAAVRGSRRRRLR